MAITFDNSGKPTYMFQAGATSTDGVWYAVGAKIDTAAGYEWTGAQTFLNTVTTDATVNMLDGFNNYLNPGARDAVMVSPTRGTICFVRQDSGGSALNQIQYYNGSAWVANDGDISEITAGTGLTGGGTSGTISLAVDTTVVATTSNTLTMTGKTLSAATLTGTLTAAATSGTNGQYLQTTGSGVQWATVTTYSAPTLGSTSITSGATVTNVDGLTINSTTIPSSKTLVATDSTVSDATTSTAARGLGYMGVPQSSAATTGAYTIVAGDAGEHIYSTATRTVTIPANASVAFPVGTAITFVAATGTTVTIAITSDTLLLAGAGTTGSRTLAPFGMATAVKITSTSWIISGNGLA